MCRVPDLAAIRAAAAAIAGQVRVTPMIPAEHDKVSLAGRVLLKLESLQVTGSFKARGVLAAL